jgi:hypothetical protein
MALQLQERAFGGYSSSELTFLLLFVGPFVALGALLAVFGLLVKAVTGKTVVELFRRTPSG